MNIKQLFEAAFPLKNKDKAGLDIASVGRAEEELSNVTKTQVPFGKRQMTFIEVEALPELPDVGDLPDIDSLVFPDVPIVPVKELVFDDSMLSGEADKTVFSSIVETDDLEPYREQLEDDKAFLDDREDEIHSLGPELLSAYETLQYLRGDVGYVDLLRLVEKDIVETAEEFADNGATTKEVIAQYQATAISLNVIAASLEDILMTHVGKP